MNRWLSPEASVGLFVLSAFAILMWGTFQLGKIRSVELGTYQLHAYFETAHGIDLDTIVEVGGVTVGRVDEIQFDEDRQQSKVLFSVDKKVRVYDDASISVRSAGLLGEAYLSLRVGTPGNPQIGEGDPISKAVSAPSIEEIMVDVREVVKSLKGTAEGLEKVLAVEQVQSDLRQTIANVRESTDVIKRLLNRNEDEINTSADALARRLPEILEDLAALAESARRVVENNESAVGEAVRGITEVEERMQLAFEELQEIAGKINRGEGTVGKLINDDTTIEAINDTVEGAQELIDSVRRWQIYTGYRGEMQFHQEDETARGIKHFVDLTLQPGFDHFYRVQLVSDPEGDLTRTLTRTETFSDDQHGFRTPLTTSTEVEETTDSDFKFSLMMAKRWHDLTIRFGIIESAGGAGIDYDLLDGDLVLSADSFDLTRPGQDWPYIRARASYHFLQYLSLSGGVSDIFNNQRKPIYQVGFGFTFNDEDLKTLFSVAPSVGF